MATVLLPNKDRNQAGARLDAGAVLEAVDYFGLQWPVTISFTAQYRTGGKHVARRSRSEERRSRDEHHIRLSTFARADELGRIAWHELAHAAQNERHGSMDAGKADAARQYAIHGYANSPREIEARAAESFNDELRLAR